MKSGEPNEQRIGEFPVDTSEDMDDAAVRILLETSKLCTACGITLAAANAGRSDCPNTNTFEHDFPGYRFVVTVKPK